MANSILLSDHFTYGRLLRFTWPSILMVLCTSVYGVVDGVMVSNFVGTTAFAALNLMWPYVTVLVSVGFMLGTGGAALVAKTLGEGFQDKARKLFSMLTYVSLLVGVAMAMLGWLTARPMVQLLGAEGEMVELSVQYGRILFVCLPFYLLQIFFQSLLVVAEKPKMGMWVTVGAGVMNMLLDVLFIGVFHWGLPGAAWATGASQFIGGVIPLGYFLFNRKSPLRLGHMYLDLRALVKACFNGLSEFVMQISLSIVSMLYNWQLLRYMGENGVAAYGIMMYFAFVFVSIFIGFNVGSAPIMSFHYGAGNHREMHSLLKKSLVLIFGFGVGIELLAQLFAHPLCAFFVGYDAELLALTKHAFRIYSIMFLYTGFNMFASSLFTSLNNGPVSALISLSRTLLLEAGCVLTLPLVFGIEGIWFSVDVAEGLTLILSLWLSLHFRKRYGY